MNLILWRHCEAEDAVPDDARALTVRGRHQAERMAKWLGGQMPRHCEVICSPAVRARQTADALGVDYRIDDRLSPEADVTDYLAAVDWPEGPAASRGNVIVVGHQPVLGRLASLLLAGQEADWTVKKGAVWWLSTRDREGGRQLLLKAAVSPDLF